MNYNPIDSCYKKAIELEGVIATIDENQIKILIRDANNSTYGIDYKKIISSTSINQGNYVVIDGVKFLIIDIELQYSQSTYNIGVFRKTQEILLGSNYKPVQAIVDKYRGQYVDGQYINEVHDQYTFIIPKLGNKTGVGSSLVYDLGIYDIISIDSSRDGLYYVTGKYSSVYTPHTYAITLNSDSQTLVQGDTFQIVATCYDNDTIVTSPTVTYTSSDPNIVSVDATGVVTGTLVGSATITCSYNNVSADLAITVEAKPVEPVVSYTTAWSQTTTITQYVTSTLTTTKTVDGVADSALYVDYSFDANMNTLISQGKLVITRKSNSSFSVKNASVSTTTYGYVTVTDHATGYKILDALKLTFTGM